MPERHRARNRARQTVAVRVEKVCFGLKARFCLVPPLPPPKPPPSPHQSLCSSVRALALRLILSIVCHTRRTRCVSFPSLSSSQSTTQTFPLFFFLSSSSSLSHNIAANVFFYSLDFCYAKCKHALVLLLVLLHLPIQFLLSATFLSFSFSFFIPFPLTLL